MLEVISAWLSDVRLLILCGSAVVGLLLAILIVLYNRGKLRVNDRVMAYVLEPLALVLGMFILAAWKSTENVFVSSDFRIGTRLESILAHFREQLLISLPVLLMIRFVRSRLVVVLFTLAWPLAVCYLYYLWKSMPVIREIRESDVVGLFDESIVLGFWTNQHRVWMCGLLCVLGGLYAVRRNFSYLRLIAGSIIIGFAGCFLIGPFNRGSGWWLAPLCYGIFTVLLVSLPGQRAGFERLLGIRLSRQTATPPLPYSPVGAMAGHLGLVILAIIMAMSAAENYYEKVMSDTIMKGVVPPWRSAADDNAFNGRERLFHKDRTSAFPTKKPADHEKALSLADEMSSGTRERILSELDAADWADHFIRLDAYIKVYENASRADYMRMPRNEMPGFLMLRDTTQAIAGRSLLSFRDGRSTEALRDIDTIYRVGGLMRDQPELVTQMIGVAVRNIATYAARNIMVLSAENPEILKALAELLEARAPHSRVGLDYTELKAGAPGIFGGPVIPSADLSLPSIARAHYNALAGWMNFDLVRLAVALERYRLDNSAYPETLAALSPVYLERVPREPYEGRDYDYAATPDGWYKLTNPAFVKRSKKSVEPFFMPPMLAVDADTTGGVAAKTSR